MRKIARTNIDKRDRGTNLTLEMLKQKEAVDIEEIKDYLDYVADRISTIEKDIY